MGRKTYVSIGKPLKGRTTIAVSRDPGFVAAGVVVAPNLAAALQTARGDALRRGADEIVIAGGADIYAQAMPSADRLELTLVHARPDGDTVFPPIDPQLWREIARSEHPAGPDDSAAYAFVTYERDSSQARPSAAAPTP
jgi:dihydrofolate reductase